MGEWLAICLALYQRRRPESGQSTRTLLCTWKPENNGLDGRVHGKPSTQLAQVSPGSEMVSAGWLKRNFLSPITAR